MYAFCKTEGSEKFPCKPTSTKRKSGANQIWLDIRTPFMVTVWHFHILFVISVFCHKTLHAKVIVLYRILITISTTATLVSRVIYICAQPSYLSNFFEMTPRVSVNFVSYVTSFLEPQELNTAYLMSITCVPQIADSALTG